ncbi:unnamed protein product [Lactuca saligna]|uniref:Uncharacterized protein n=1 Tax=Lactuca saligna TaxID=75948 RepID=A0AA35ZDE6_LACSI|nr:unnamed protein product [Lactuca saligna]
MSRKTKKLTKKQFAKIMQLSMSVWFAKSLEFTIWFVLRCLTGWSTLLDKAKLEGLILRKVYTQEGILFPIDHVMTEYSSMTIPKVLVNDLKIFPMIARILDSMFNLVTPSHEFFVHYLVNIGSTTTGSLPPKVSNKGAEGISHVDTSINYTTTIEFHVVTSPTLQPPLSSPPYTSTIVLPTSTLLSQKFSGVLQQPIVALFSSRSIEH